MNATKWNRPGLALALSVAGAFGAHAAVAETKKVPAAHPKPAVHAAKHPAVQVVHHVPLPRHRPLPPASASAAAPSKVALHGPATASPAMFAPVAHPLSGRFEPAPATAVSADDIAAVKRVIEASRKGNQADADAAEKTIADPVARKLAEWAILRSDNTKPSFARYAAFVNANPAWPHSPLFRRRAENALWNDNLDDAAVLAFFTNHKPRTAKGGYMLARARLAKGDREGAATLVRNAWRHEDCSADVENKVIETFGSMLTRADHKVRMEQRFYSDDIEAGMRAATRLGGDDLAIGRARAAVIKQLNNAKALLDAVPASARHDPGYIFARVQWLRKENKSEEAGQLILTVPQDPAALVDLDQWWLERRLLVRKLLDDNDAQTAYRVAREAAPPMRGNYRVDAYFTAGWIALRFADNPKAAYQHFARVGEGIVSAIGSADSYKDVLENPPRPWASARRPRPITKRRRNTPRPITARLRARGWA